MNMNDTKVLDGVDADGYVGKIMKDGKVVGRIDMGSDGKAMVFVGESGDKRVRFATGTEAMYSDDDAPLMVQALLTEPQAAQPVINQRPADNLAASARAASSGKLGLHVIQYPSGRFGYVGTVPDAIAYEPGATQEQINNGKQFGERFGPKKMTFSTAEEAVKYAKDRGFDVISGGEPAVIDYPAKAAEILPSLNKDERELLGYGMGVMNDAIKAAVAEGYDLNKLTAAMAKLAEESPAGATISGGDIELSVPGFASFSGVQNGDGTLSFNAVAKVASQKYFFYVRVSKGEDGAPKIGLGDYRYETFTGKPVRGAANTKLEELMDVAKAATKEEAAKRFAASATQTEAPKPAGPSDQFQSYADWINSGKEVSAGMREQIMGDERLNQPDEAERLIAMVDAKLANDPVYAALAKIDAGEVYLNAKTENRIAKLREGQYSVSPVGGADFEKFKADRDQVSALLSDSMRAASAPAEYPEAPAGWTRTVGESGEYVKYDNGAGVTISYGTGKANDRYAYRIQGAPEGSKTQGFAPWGGYVGDSHGYVTWERVFNEANAVADSMKPAPQTDPQPVDAEKSQAERELMAQASDDNDGAQKQRDAEKMTEAKTFLQSVIDGSADMMDLELADRLTAIHDQFAGDSEMLALFNEAAKAYSGWMIDAAKRAMS